MISIRHIKKSYEGQQIFKDLSFEVKDREIIGLIGPSGSGKSTLLRYIIMLDEPDSGEMFLNDQRIDIHADTADKIREKIGMVFQDFNLFANYTVIENVLSGLIHVKHMDPRDALDSATEIIKDFGMWDKAFSYPKVLSGGQKQRAAIARTVAMNPEVLLFDEPTSALDPSMKGEVDTVIRKLAARGTTMVIVSHEMELLRGICTKLIFINDGINFEEGTPDKILDNPDRPETKRFVKALRNISFDIDSKEFDFIGMNTIVEEFTYRNAVPSDIKQRFSAIMEELCQMIIINPKEANRMHISFEYSYHEQTLSGVVSFTGPEFDTDNPMYFISWPIIKMYASEVNILKSEDPMYTNMLGIDLAPMR